MKRFLIALDQLGNTIAGGSEDATISARIGYHVVNKPNRYWEALRFLVDSLFEPLEGDNHCKRAYHKDMGETFKGATFFARVLLFWGVLAFFVVFILPFWAVNLWTYWRTGRKLHAPDCNLFFPRLYPPEYSMRNTFAVDPLPTVWAIETSVPWTADELHPDLIFNAARSVWVLGYGMRFVLGTGGVELVKNGEYQ